jgi:K+-sensing histidine kinase KdpD
MIYFKKINSTKDRINFVFENILLFVWFMLGMILTIDSIKPEYPQQFEPWYIHQFMLFLMTLVYSLKWKRLTICYCLQKTTYLVIMYSRYGSKLSHTTIFAQLAVMAIYPSLCVIVCKLILSFLIAVHRNKQLAESIKHILQVFPECVIIRNRKHEEAVTVFMNNEAANDLYDVDNLKIQIVADKDENQNVDIPFDSLLNSQEEKANLESNFDNSDKEKLVVTYQSSQENVELEPKFYTLTTVKVNWVSSMNSYMHVFIDTTDIHKLEKAKVTNKCMHIMFSSISHELRTPINAFVNANEMIKFGADSIKKFDCMKKLSSKNIENVSKMLDLIDKHTRIATVSSNLLLNLTEDILDFAKIEAGIFTLNSKIFIIIELINEIMFIFEHQ